MFGLYLGSSVKTMVSLFSYVPEAKNESDQYW